jgi:hypothetical protein
MKMREVMRASILSLRRKLVVNKELLETAVQTFQSIHDGSVIQILD